MSNNSLNTTSSPTSSLDAANEKELNWQKAYNKQPESSTTKLKNVDDKHSKAQQPNQITLEEIKNATQHHHQQHHQLKPQLQQMPQKAQENITTTAANSSKVLLEDHQHHQQQQEDEEQELESNEKEHLLGGQVQPVNSAIIAARVNFKDAKDLPTTAATTSQFRSSNKSVEGNCHIEDHGAAADIPNKHPDTPLGSWSSNAASATSAVEDIDLKVHSKLELQKFPQEMLQSHNNKEQNGSTIILTPTSLTTASGATSHPAGGQSGNNMMGGGGGGGCHGGGEYQGPKFWQYMARNYAISSQPLAILFIFFGLWILGYILLPQYAVPSSVIMRIALLFVGAQAAGILVTFIHLPDMLGMLFFGVLYANVGWANFEGYAKFEGFLREMALINIMLLAGLGLDANAFKKLWFMITRLTLIPTIAEVAVIAVLAYLMLNMSWLWGILLGLVITAVSPNVVVTVMLKLKEDRLGLNNGIHTLIYAMTTCNDVVAIFLFGVINGVIFSKGGSLTEQILQGPIGIGIGIVYGYLYGLMLQFVPSRNSTYANGLRFVLTILGGAISVMGSKAIKYPSAGALGCVTVAFVAGIGWKRQQLKLTTQQRQADENSSVPKRLDLLWKFLKPVSFALIGKEINFAVLDGKVVGYGALLVLLGSLARLAFAYISTYGGNLSRKERAYITISGFPKATVQAALGPIALDMAREINADADIVSLARNVLIISVLAIIFTAPLGAILMLRLAPKWLKHSPAPQQTNGDGSGYGGGGEGGYNSHEPGIDNYNPNNNAQRV